MGLWTGNGHRQGRGDLPFLRQDRQDLGVGVCRGFGEDVVAALVDVA
jgi:hypothetical protein